MKKINKPSENKIIVLQGVPGSGKSTLARKMVFNDTTNMTVRVCRDDIRSMLGQYWVPTREGLVTSIEDSTTEYSLGAGYDVIIDATNLNKLTSDKWKLLAKKLNVDIEFVLVNASQWLCIWRDWKRGLFGGRRVGSKVIMSFYNRYEDLLNG